MKRAVVALIAVGVVAGAAAPAQAQTRLERQVAALQRTVAAQRRQVATLQRQVTSLRRQANQTASCPATASSLPPVCQLALEAGVVAYCTAAITGDAFQNTWAVINQVGNRSVVFGPPVTLDDAGFCNALRVTRQPTLVPPTIAPFQQMLQRLDERTIPFSLPWWLSVP